ncbi:SURF1 family cytochrome oxidase biogenesis protein [Nocardia sp. Marseille-Q1738]
MRRLAFLLRPSWLILAVLVAAFAYLCFTVLAPWQLGKNTATSHRNQLIADSVKADPVDVTAVLSDTNAATEWRRVTASGTYVPDSTVLVRLRHLDGAPGYAVLATFRLADGRVLLVDRGLVSAVDGTRPPSIPGPPAGPQRIEARIRMSEGVTPGKDPSVRTATARCIPSTPPRNPLSCNSHSRRCRPANGGYLQLSENQPGAFTTPSPARRGPYLSYGLQWLAFGIMAPLGLGYFIYAEIRERRKEKRSAATTPAEATLAGSTSANQPTAPAATTTEARLADRYGRS